MLPVDVAISFLGIAILLGYSPGPDNVFVLMQSAMQGRRAGMLVVLGLCTGLIVHTTAIAFGLAAVFAASATAFTVLKLIGAAYLLYMAYGAFNAPADTADKPEGERLAAGSLYLRGIVMNLTNPKVVLFFLAFLPQFVSAERGPLAPQFFQLGALFILATLIAFGSIAWFAATAGQFLRKSARAQIALNRIAATVFAGLALKLAMAQR